ncbi:MAG: leucyl aminopeptidase [Polyangiales bacterium]
MKIELKGGNAAEAKVDLLVVGAFAASRTSKKGGSRALAWAANPLLDALDHALGGAITALAARDEFTGKSGAQLCVPTLGRLAARCLLIVGLGDSAALKPAQIRAFGARAARTANAEKATSLAVVAPVGDAESLRALGEGLPLGAYRFTRHLTGERVPRVRIDAVSVFVERSSPSHKSALALGRAIGDSVCIARDLVSEPPNVLDAPELANRAVAVAKAHKLKVQVFGKAEIARRGMRLLMAVNQGSKTEPRFVHMTYVPAKKAGAKAPKRLVFVGKGLTFDSGGLCIKPADGMLDMKIDMGGAANVIALMAAVGVLRPNVEVHGIFAATDNMPDGDAYQPGDVFKSMGGKTVEIINTDAEGRLVLADALVYAQSLKPDLLVDNATLTGACMVALGNTCSGYYANRDEVSVEFEACLKASGEQMWRLPLLEDLRDQLKSEVADMKHMGSRYGGSITAALFLREFVGDLPWIHCDIAGPVTSDKAVGFYNKGATGHGVLTFLELVERFAKKS